MSLFGNTNSFGSLGQSSTLFGNNNNQSNNSMFTQNQTNSTFGAGGLFNNQNTFNNNNNNTGGMFGGNTNNNNSSTKLFGGNSMMTNTNSTGGLFGGNNNNAVNNTNIQSNGTFNFAYQMLRISDAKETINMVAITGNDAFKLFSQEELRIIDLQLKKSGRQPMQGGMMSNTTNTIFGGNNTSMQNNNTGGLFGGNNTTTTTIGGGLFQSNTNTNGGLFSGNNNNSSTLFGKNNNTGGLFNQNNNGLNNNNKGLLNNTVNTNTGGLFGGNTNNNSTAGLFGGSNNTVNNGNSLFGGNQNNNNSIFNKPQQQGGGLFGNTQNSTQGGLFGNGTSQQSNTGNSLFGGNTGNSLFGNTNIINVNSTGTLFGGATNTNNGGDLFTNANNTNTTGGLFSNTTNNTNNGGGLFNNTNSNNNTGNTLFGNKPANTQTGGLFGNTNTNTSGGLFGPSSTNTNTTSGGLFGNSNTTTTNNNSGGLFGNAATTNSTSSGGLFSNTTTNSLLGNPSTTNKPTILGSLLSNNTNNKPTGGLFGSVPNTASSLFSTTPSNGATVTPNQKNSSQQNVPQSGNYFQVSPTVLDAIKTQKSIQNFLNELESKYEEDNNKLLNNYGNFLPRHFLLDKELSRNGNYSSPSMLYKSKPKYHKMMRMNARSLLDDITKSKINTSTFMKSPTNQSLLSTSSNNSKRKLSHKDAAKNNLLFQDNLMSIEEKYRSNLTLRSDSSMSHIKESNLPPENIINNEIYEREKSLKENKDINIIKPSPVYQCLTIHVVNINDKSNIINDIDIIIDFVSVDKNSTVLDLKEAIKERVLSRLSKNSIKDIEITSLSLMLPTGPLEDTKTLLDYDTSLSLTNISSPIECYIRLSCSNVEEEPKKRKISITASTDLVAPDELVPKLSREGYHTSPEYVLLCRMSSEELRNVKDFRVYNKYGEVHFLEKVNILGMNIDEEISIEERCVEIKETEKGKGLNVNREIKLNGMLINNGMSNVSVEKKKEMIKEKIKEFGGIYQELDVESGILKFKVIVS